MKTTTLPDDVMMRVPLSTAAAHSLDECRREWDAARSALHEAINASPDPQAAAQTEPMDNAQALPALPEPSAREYVRSQSQTRKHHCHWPGCDKQVPPAMWGCKAHWFALPAGLRARIWATFRPGQEVNGTPSADYIAAAKDVQAWINRPAAPSAAAGKE